MGSELGCSWQREQWDTILLWHSLILHFCDVAQYLSDEALSLPQLFCSGDLNTGFGIHNLACFSYNMQTDSDWIDNWTGFNVQQTASSANRMAGFDSELAVEKLFCKCKNFLAVILCFELWLIKKIFPNNNVIFLVLRFYIHLLNHFVDTKRWYEVGQGIFALLGCTWGQGWNVE